MPGHFVIKRSTNGEFFFNLHAESGEILLSSETYRAKDSAQKGIRSVRKNSQEDRRYDRRDNGQQYWFVLKARNGEIIGKSRMFDATEQRDAAMRTLAEQGATETVRDES